MTQHLRYWSVLLVGALLTSGGDAARAATFVDRWDPGDLRVVSYNIFIDSIFTPPPWADQDIPDRFERVVQALDPDILALQEIYNHSASAVVAKMNSIAPLPGGASWFAHSHSDNVILSKHPFLLTTSSVGHADALIDLPDDRFDKDLFVVNDHFPCCDNERGRQFEADQLVGWLEDARTPGGAIDLPADTPFLVVGDLNIVRSGRPLETLLTGETVNDFFATDSPPDWDGTPITDAHPLQNGFGVDDYTWRNDSDVFDPGVLDFILFSDSVLETANRFVLNPSTMSGPELAATGLQANDVVIDVADGFFDHLPVVVDFRLRAETIPGDYNGDGAVDALDLAAWRTQYGRDAAPPADGNGDGVVDAADYVFWRERFAAASAAVPEPGSLGVLSIAAFAVAISRRGRRVR